MNILNEELTHKIVSKFPNYDDSRIFAKRKCVVKNFAAKQCKNLVEQ